MASMKAQKQPERLVTNSATRPRWAMPGGAIFDATGRYRYSLWRCWDPQSPRLVFILLNPSTADATQDDPTLRRCCQFAQGWGYGSVEVVNLFAYRATHPRELRQSPQPVGAENDIHVLAAVQAATRVIVAWGNGGTWQGRDRTLLALLAPTPLYCLGLNQSGQPRHPLYLPGTTAAIAFTQR